MGVRWYSHDTHKELPRSLGKVPSVTTFLDVIDKSGPLVGWAVREERKAFRLAMQRVMQSGVSGDDDLWDAVIKATEGIKQSDRILKDSGDIGTQAHGLIDWETKRRMKLKGIGPEPHVREESYTAYLHWRQWAQQNDFIPLKTEFVVWSEDGFAGRCDVYAKVNGRSRVIDYKTSSGVYVSHILQAIAYHKAAANVGIYPEEPPLILRLPKDPSGEEDSFHVFDLGTDLGITPDDLYPAVISAKDLWWARRNLEKALRRG